MTLRLLTTPLLAAGLLLSTLGCAKKEETPTPTPVSTGLSTGSYKLDTQALTCQARATTSTFTNGSITREYVNVELFTIPVPASGEQRLLLTYSRTSPSAPYQFSEATLFEKNTVTLSGGFTGTSGAVTANADGSFSGTFAAKDAGKIPAAYQEITAGSFSRARP